MSLRTSALDHFIQNKLYFQCILIILCYVWRLSARRFYYTFESAFEVSRNFLGSYTARYKHEAEQRKLQECSLAQRQYSTRFAPTFEY